MADVAAKNYPTYAKKIDEVMDSLGYSISYSNKDQSAAIMDFSSIEPYPATFLSLFLLRYHLVFLLNPFLVLFFNLYFISESVRGNKKRNI